MHKIPLLHFLDEEINLEKNKNWPNITTYFMFHQFSKSSSLTICTLGFWIINSEATSCNGNKILSLVIGKFWLIICLGDEKYRLLGRDKALIDLDVQVREEEIIFLNLSERAHRRSTLISLRTNFRHWVGGNLVQSSAIVIHGLSGL